MDGVESEDFNPEWAMQALPPLSSDCLGADRYRNTPESIALGEDCGIL